MSKFSERLKELRAEKKLSCKKLGDLIGVSDATICRWENGVNKATTDDLVNLAKVLGVSLNYLLGLED